MRPSNQEANTETTSNKRLLLFKQKKFPWCQNTCLKQQKTKKIFLKCYTKFETSVQICQLSNSYL